jgi:hypothetical protein
MEQQRKYRVFMDLETGDLFVGTPSLTFIACDGTGSLGSEIKTWCLERDGHLVANMCVPSTYATFEDLGDL